MNEEAADAGETGALPPVPPQPGAAGRENPRFGDMRLQPGVTREHVRVLGRLGFEMEDMQPIAADKAEAIRQLDLRAEQGKTDCEALKGAKRFGKIAGVVAIALAIVLISYLVFDGSGDRRMNAELVATKAKATELQASLVSANEKMEESRTAVVKLEGELSKATAANATLEAKILEANGAAKSAFADAERAERERDEAVTKANGAVDAVKPILAKAEADAKVAIDAAQVEASRIVTEAKAKADAEVARVSAEAKAKVDAEVTRAIVEAQAKAKVSISTTPLPSAPAPETTAGGRQVIHFVTGEPNGTYNRKGPAHPYQDALREYAMKVRAGAVRNPSGKDAFEAMAEALDAAATGKKLTPAQINALESARDNFMRRGLTRDASNVSAALAAQ